MEYKDPPSSPLVLRQPFIDAALARLEKAQLQLKLAQSELNKTRIVAPFNAVIVKTHISPGQYLQKGDKIAELYSTKRIDIAVSVESKHWQLLSYDDILDRKSLEGKAIENKPVVLRDRQGTQWHGKIDRVERHLNSATRQRVLVINVDNPLEQNPALLPGSFVTANIPGAKIDNLLAVPVSALSADGLIWFITKKIRSLTSKLTLCLKPMGNYLSTRQLTSKIRPKRVKNPSLALLKNPCPLTSQVNW